MKMRRARLTAYFPVEQPSEHQPHGASEILGAFESNVSPEKFQANVLRQKYITAGDISVVGSQRFSAPVKASAN